MTQSQLSAQSGLALQTIRNLEHGRGSIKSLATALAHLKLTIVGRHLPPAPTIGGQISALRRSRKISQRALARDAGVTHPTIIALERHARGRFATLDRVLTLLAAGQRIVLQGTEQSFFASAANSSAHHNWHTPPALHSTPMSFC